jgi:putative FmdB family regulatory protein
MPIYEYKCKKCGNLFEELRSFSEREDAAACPKCGHGKSVLSEGSYRINTSSSGARDTAPTPCDTCNNGDGCAARRG